MPFSAKTIRVLRPCLAAAACIATLYTLIWVFEDWRSQRAWNRLREGRRLEVLLPAASAVPAAENFFEYPAVKEILIDTKTSPDPKSLRAMASSPISAGRKESLESIAKKLPPTTAASTEASTQSLSPAQQILTYFAPWEPALAEIRFAARTRSQASLVYPEPLTPENIFRQFEIINWDTTFGLSRVVHMHARAAIADEKYKDGFEDVLILFRLGNGLTRSPHTLLQYLVGRAVLDFGIETVKEGLELHAWTNDQLHIFQRELGAPNPSPSDTLTIFGTCLQQENRLATLALNDPRPETLGIEGPPWWLPVSYKTWCRFSIIRVITHQEEQQNLLTRPGPEGVAVRLRTMHANAQTVRTYSPYGNLVKSFNSNFSTIFVDCTRSIARRPLAATACALERYRLAHDRHPESLDQLVPVHLSAIPSDAINNGSLRYQRNSDDTFLLYSMGLDGDDDNGHRAPGDSNDLTADGDWAW